MSLSKMSVSGAFDKLSKKRKDAVRLVFEHNLTDAEIAKKWGFLRMLIIVNFLGFYVYGV